MLRSTSYLKHLLLFKHSRIQLERLELVLVIAVAKHVVFTHTPGVHLVLVGHYCVRVVACSGDAGHFFVLFVILYVILLSKVPEELVSHGPSEVADCAEVFLLGFLGLFNRLAALKSLPGMRSSLISYLLFLSRFLLSVVLSGGGSLSFFVLGGLLLVFDVHGCFLFLFLLFGGLGFVFFCLSFFL